MCKSPLNLVCFGQGPQEQQLLHALEQNCQAVEVSDGPRWLDRTCTNHNPVILSLGEKTGRLSHYKKLLTKLKDVPSLVVVSRRRPFRMTHLLETCADFLTWPCTAEEFQLRVERLCQIAAHPSTEDEPPLDVAGMNLIGRSHLFRKFLTRLRKTAACEVPVLIEGETGTGKEVAARAIHYLGARQDHPFIPVNCGALPDDLVENELFGHESGAYTDAKGTQEGAVTQADKGTLFLDEIESLSPRAQVALLRFLQDQTFKPLGGRQLRRVDVRVIAACNRNLHRLVEQHAFRQDLLFRLDVADLHAPPLRKRDGDIRLLAEHYLEKYARKFGQTGKSIHPDTLAWMEVYRWPGNVRELENFIQKGLLASTDEYIRVESVNTSYSSEQPLPFPEEPQLLLDLDFNEAKRIVVNEFEEQYLRHLLAQTGGNVSLAASKAGKERSAFGRLLKKHGIDRTRYTHSR